ncbi:GroES-like protein [Mycena leptocephala]|nr:GroES-like protein [Mycena leptocephala]
MATLPSTMRAFVVSESGDVDKLKLETDVQAPKPSPGFAIIKVKAFGINHAETHMRKGEWTEAMPIIGIECVGVIVSAIPATEGGTTFEPGTHVITLMGGLGRTINGTYAEYTSAPISNIVAVPRVRVVELGWARLAAIPETYATAWTCIMGILDVQPGDKLLVRGATSALGNAAVRLAINNGTIVTATTRNSGRAEGLKSIGVHDVLIEDGVRLSEKLVVEGRKWDKVLELIGNSTVMGSLKLVRRNGRLCLAGWLGGVASVPGDFNPLRDNMPSGVHFSFFMSPVFGEKDWPLTDIPLADIAGQVAAGKLDAQPSRILAFSEEGVREAHKLMEASQAGGKMVVLVDPSV